jgi:hypothetical protein
MQCPICKQKVSWVGNPFRPFCSERCKLIDLDNWLEGRYRVASRVLSEPDDQSQKSIDDPEREIE